MSKVVVGFDFSSGSAYAVDLAIDIANRWQADIRLVYVKEKKEDETPIRSEIERRNKGVEHLLRNIKLEYVLREGNPADELVAQAKEDDAMLLVVGTHGLSGMKTNLLGRNSYKTIENATVPVLVIREDFNFHKPLEKIILPIDNSESTRQKVAQASFFARTFGATIHVVGLYTSTIPDVRRIVDGYLNSVVRYFEKSGAKFIVEKRDVSKNVTATTLEYANEQQADLIVIMTDQETNLNSLFLGTYAQQLLNQSKIPVLTVRPKSVESDVVD